MLQTLGFEINLSLWSYGLRFQSLRVSKNTSTQCLPTLQLALSSGFVALYPMGGAFENLLLVIKKAHSHGLLIFKSRLAFYFPSSYFSKYRFQSLVWWVSKEIFLPSIKA